MSFKGHTESFAQKLINRSSTIVDWRPHTPFYYGWLVIGTAATGAFAATGVAQIVIGGIQGLILDDMSWSRSTIAFAVTAGTLASGILSPFIGKLADRYGPRLLMPLSALVVGSCYFALANIHTIWQFYLAYIIARAVANPNLIGIVPQTVSVNFFHRKRNFVLGITSMARPVGGAINIQIIMLIAQAFSWRHAYRYLGVFSFILILPLFIIMRRKPEDMGLNPDGDPSSSAEIDSGSVPSLESLANKSEFSWEVREAIGTSAFWLIVIAETLSILTAGALSFHSVPFLEDSGLPKGLAATALSISVLLGAIVNPGWGYLSDRFSPRTLGLVALTTTVLATSLFLIAILRDSTTIGFMAVITWGLASGGVNILSNMMMARYFGRNSYGSITGLTGPFKLVGLGIGPALGAILHNITGGYYMLFLYAIGAYLLAIILIFYARQPSLPPRAMIQENSSTEGGKPNGNDK